MLQSGEIALNDYDFKQPGRDDLKVREIMRNEHSNSEFDVFDYPGEHDKYLSAGDKATEGERNVRNRMEGVTARHATVSGVSDGRALLVGGLFSLHKHLREDQNGEYLIVWAKTTVKNGAPSAGASGDGGDAACTCELRAIDSKVTYRPPRLTRKAMMMGPQTAVVTGKKDEEIDTDEFGRVRVQFHWHRQRKGDPDTTSCWVRVSQSAAGRGWGAMSVPRIGQEVIVDFLEGDPDRPIVTGRVYNGANMPPYKLPEFATYTTFKSNSSKGGQGFNELRFEDKKGAEQIFMHAERNQDIRVKNDRSAWVGHDTHKHVVGKSYELVAEDKHLTVTGDLKERVKNASLTVDAEHHEKVGSRYAMTAGQEVHIDAGSKIVLEAGASVTLKVGSSFLQVTASGITASGSISLNSGGVSATGGGADPEPPTLPRAADDDAAGEVAEPPPLKSSTQSELDAMSVEVMLSAAAGAQAFVLPCKNCV